MSTSVSTRARLGFAVFVLASVALFAVLAARFGGPSLKPGDVDVVRVSLPDAQGLPGHADVLVRGVEVGHVGAMEAAGDRVTADLELDAGHPPLRADASVRVAGKTPLGEAFVALDPGRASARHDESRPLAVRDSVQIDDALSTLGPRSRGDLRALLDVSARGLAGGPEDLGSTVEGTERAARELRTLTETLAGQDDDVAASVTSTRAVLEELGRHDADLRGILADGTTALRAAARQPDALRAALERAPSLLDDTRTTLAAARPLLRDARPVVNDVRTAAPALAAAMDDAVGPLRQARAISAGLPALRRDGEPALTAARALLPVAGPALRELGPVLANAAPMAGYLAPRANTIPAWFANTDALGRNGDAKGRWARFFVGFDPATALGGPGAPAGNSYTKPGDATANAPYEAGDFPRLRATPKP